MRPEIFLIFLISLAPIAEKTPNQQTAEIEARQKRQARMDATIACIWGYVLIKDRSYNLLMQAPPINEDEMQMMLEWLDGIPFSKSKKNITRDFADGVFVAEMMKIYFPDLVQLHNYPPVSAKNAKFSNWKTLNQKVFKKIKFQIHPNDIRGIIEGGPGYIERVLFVIFSKIKKHEQERSAENYTSVEGRNAVLSSESKINSQISAQLAQKQQAIVELRSAIQILQTKMKRMQELNRLKDAKIDSLMRKLEENIN